MYLIFQILLILYLIYCFSYCTLIIYTAITEEWCCSNKIPIWINHYKRRNYQPINKKFEINIV